MDCGTFGLRGYRPISLAVIGSDSVNTAPTSPSADHTGTFQPYTTSETRINMSVRTKVAQGLLTGGDPNRLDSLWFAYSQQSYWQLFNADLSRPFRATDHEPELIYIFPVESALPSGWRLRYGGIGINHQSNGQSLPLSRSWNRIIGRAGLELGEQSFHYRCLVAADSRRQLQRRQPRYRVPGRSRGTVHRLECGPAEFAGFHGTPFVANR